jgi:alpha-glucosidase (family GH31 glycosyl hydrolase)
MVDFLRFVLLALLITAQSWAAERVVRRGIRLGATSVHLHFLDDRVLRLDFLRPGGVPDQPSAMIVQQSFPGPQAFEEQGERFATGALKIQPDGEGNCLVVSAEVVLTRICPTLSKTGLALHLHPESIKNIYGLGEQFHKPNKMQGDWVGHVRSSSLPAGNRVDGFERGGAGNAQFGVIYALGEGTNNFALFLDQVAPLTWDFRSSPWQILSGARKLSVYLIAGKDPLRSRMKFMDLVGHPPVPPKRAFGFWMSEFGYRSWQEIRDIAHELREKKIPVDGFVLDAFWYGPFESFSKKNQFGNMDFHPSYFPDAARQISELARYNQLELMTHETPFINTNRPEFEMMQRHGYLVRTDGPTSPPRILDNYLGSMGWIDWTHPQAAGFWHHTKRKPLTNKGIRMHWTDFSEFDSYGGEDWFAGVGSKGHSTRENHNLYPFRWTESIAEGYKHESLRHFIMSRSGTPGMQRFGAGMWSGDLGSNKESLQAHYVNHSSLSLSGMDYFSSDIGGYHREALTGKLDAGYERQKDELYTRWMARCNDPPFGPAKGGSFHHLEGIQRLGAI